MIFTTFYYESYLLEYSVAEKIVCQGKNTLRNVVQTLIPFQWSFKMFFFMFATFHKAIQPLLKQEKLKKKWFKAPGKSEIFFGESNFILRMFKCFIVTCVESPHEWAKRNLDESCH